MPRNRNEEETHPDYDAICRHIRCLEAWRYSAASYTAKEMFKSYVSLSSDLQLDLRKRALGKSSDSVRMARLAYLKELIGDAT